MAKTPIPITPERIALEISRLKTLQELIPPLSMFGDNNKEAIRSQIAVLQENLTEREIDQRYEPETTEDEDEDALDQCFQDPEKSEYIHESAQNALLWREGRYQENPAGEWEPMASLQRLDPSEAENLLQIPAPKWAARCHEISALLLKNNYPPAQGGTLHYGHYLGPTQPGSLFHQRGLICHGWIQTIVEGKTVIIDPTRWVFENTEPYIYVGPLDYYDDGGQEMALTRKGQTPEPKGEPLANAPKNPILQEILTNEGIPTNRKLTFSEILHIANLPPKAYPQMKQAYQWIIRIGKASLIPQDFLRITNLEN